MAPSKTRKSPPKPRAQPRAKEQLRSSEASQTSFVDPFNDHALLAYLRNVNDWHGYIRFLGLPHLKDNPDTPIDRLFVEPKISPSPLSPDSPPEHWNNLQTPFEAMKELPRLVLLGDPGSGKSTLVSWLAWLFASPSRTLWRSEFGDLIPFPFVLRELKIGADITWDGLLEAFLEHPMAEPLRGAKGRIEDILMRGQGLLMFDGLDEIGSIEVRNALQKAVEKGMNRFLACRWLLTSRIVGYDECPFPNQKVVPLRDMVDKKHRPSVRGVKATLRYSEERYVAPFDDGQIAQFARNWYFRHEKQEEEARKRADDLIHAVRAHESTRRLARIPNLLTLIALIHRVFRVLPHGRAMLYDKIVEAYLESIDQFRGIAEAHYPLAKMKRWLAYVGYQMQLKRQSQKPTNDDAREILAGHGEVLGWLAEAMRKSGVEKPDEEAGWYLGFLGRRSGLFLPRAEDRFAFTHLSFQEYFAACHLSDRLLSPRFLGSEKAAQAETNQLVSLASSGKWSETFLFLFEMLGEHEEWPHTLLRLVFKSVLEGEWKGKEEKGPLARLLAEVSVDPHTGLSLDERKEAWKACWGFGLGESQESSLSFFIRIPSVLLGSKAFSQRLIWEALYEAYVADKHTCLDLSGSEGIDDLTPLAKLESIQNLNLSFCRGITDLTPIKSLENLNLLWLAGCTGVTDLTSLSNLQNLTLVFLHGCTGVTDLTPLTSLQNLAFLSLSGCAGVTDFTPLTSLQNLKTLDLDWCMELTDLNPLISLRNLRTLNLIRCTGVTDLTPLIDLPNLTDLFVASCPAAENIPIELKNRKGLTIYT
jgi:internalin A